MQRLMQNREKVIKWTGLTDEQKEAMKQQAREVRAGGSYFYKPGWTTGYWPTKKQPSSIDNGASLVGNYALTTSYTGNVEIKAPPGVEFLAGIVMSSPNLDKKLDLKKAINFKWAEIPKPSDSTRRSSARRARTPSSSGAPSRRSPKG